MMGLVAGLAAVNLLLLVFLLWKLSAGSELQALRVDLAERVARASGETQQAVADRLSSGLAEGRRDQENKFIALQQALHLELAGSRGEVSSLLTGLLNAQRQSLTGFQETVEKRLDVIRDRTDQRLGEIGRQVERKLDENIQEGFRHFDQVQKSLRAAEEQLAGLNTVGSSITELNSLLKLPHLRGGFGEAMLERLLADFLPTSMYELQAPIGDAQERVDAVVKFPQHLLPIDSKFPREQVAPLFEAADPAQMADARRELSRVMRAQAARVAKYIRPDAGTTDMALLFLPSEILYFEVLRDTDLWQALMKMKVFPVSPNTLATTLQGIGLAYKSYKMRLDVEETLEQVKRARRYFELFEGRFQEVKEGLEKAGKAFETAEKHLQRYSTSVGRLTGEPVEEQLTLPDPGAAGVAGSSS